MSKSVDKQVRQRKLNHNYLDDNCKPHMVPKVLNHYDDDDDDKYNGIEMKKMKDFLNTNDNKGAYVKLNSTYFDDDFDINTDSNTNNNNNNNNNDNTNSTNSETKTNQVNNHDNDDNVDEQYIIIDNTTTNSSDDFIQPLIIGIF